jgi:hypothetical protein
MNERKKGVQINLKVYLEHGKDAQYNLKKK